MKDGVAKALVDAPPVPYGTVRLAGNARKELRTAKGDGVMPTLYLGRFS